MPQDIDQQTFEQSVAELAINTLKTQVPALMDYALGFQLVDRSEDDTRAVGFFGFKIGEGLIYVPIFFLGGEVKGTELCYVVDEDRFVPLTEDWVNQLIRRKTFSIGDTAGKDRVQQGISGPDLRRLRVPPMEAKISADLTYNGWAPWAQHGAKMFERALSEEKLAVPTLPDVLAKHNITEAFIENMKAEPKLATAVFSFYKPEDFVEAVEKVAKSKEPVSQCPVFKREVRVFSGDDALRNPAELGFLSEDEKKQVMKGNTVVQDGRLDTEKRKVYDIETTKKLQNPGEGGHYEVVTEAGEVAGLFVLEPKFVGTGGSRDIRLLINDKGEYLLAPKTGIFTTQQSSREDTAKALAKLGSLLSEKDAWDTDSADGFVIIDGAGKYAIGPFTADIVVENADGTTSIFVQQQIPELRSKTDIVNAGAHRQRKGMPFDGVAWTTDGAVNLNDGGDCNNNPYMGWQSHWDSVRRIVVTDKPLKNAVFANGIAMVPRGAGFRVVKLGKQLQGSSAPGSTADLYLKINKFAEDLEVNYDGQLFRIRRGENTVPAATVKRAYEVLCQDVGIGAEDATDIIKTAQDTPRITKRYFVEGHDKLAAPPFDHPDFAAHHEPLFDAPVQQGGMSVMNLMPEHASFDPGASQKYRHFKDENNYSAIYGKDIENLNNATQTGQQEVFDASAIGALANVSDVNQEIEEYLPVFMKCLDKLGRALFLFYWNSEDLQERYGKTESKDLQEDVQNVFEHLGDVVLDLKRSSPNTSDIFGSGIIGGGSTAASASN